MYINTVSLSNNFPTYILQVHFHSTISRITLSLIRNKYTHYCTTTYCSPPPTYFTVNYKPYTTSYSGTTLHTPVHGNTSVLVLCYIGTGILHLTHSPTTKILTYYQVPIRLHQTSSISQYN